MKFKYNNLEYEVPPGINIEVEVKDDHADFNFVWGDNPWGEHIPKLGGVDNYGDPVESWDDAGIKELA